MLSLWTCSINQGLTFTVVSFFPESTYVIRPTTAIKKTQIQGGVGEPPVPLGLRPLVEGRRGGS